MKTLLRFLCIGLCALLFASCYGPRKAQRQVLRAGTTYADILARYCGTAYPIQAFDSVRVEYRPGRVVTDTSWLTVDCDSVLRADLNPTKSGLNKSVVRVPCPPSTHRIDTVYKERFRTEESTAKLAAQDSLHARERRDWEAKLAESEKQKNAEVVAHAETKTGSKTRLWFAIGGWGLIALVFAVRFLKPRLIS